MKKCITCEEVLPLDNFGICKRNTDGYNNKCKKCKRKYDNKYYNNKSEKEKNRKYQLQKDRLTEIRKFIFDYLSDKKCKCGESHIATLDFHHIGEKSFNISCGVRAGLSLDKIKKEIEKCVIMCANCHRKETMKEQG